MSTMNLSLMTDLYELTMMQGYFKSNAKEKVVFDVFYRKNPCDGGYAIAAGLEQAIDYIKNLKFSYEDVAYLKSLGIFDEDFLNYLRGFHFSGDIYARVVYSAQGDGIMEFGLRRAQGPDAGIYGARAAVIGGCVGTSNVLTGQLFQVPVMGTHAHSWIMSFPDEYTAFKTYAQLYPNACILLVDTYDTLRSGVPNAIRVFNEMKEAGIPLKNYGIRLDSGDLAYMSKKARKMLDDAGYPDATIAASSDLDEYLINSLKNQNAKITSWGVGTNMITSKDWPSFGGVYKLAAIYAEDHQSGQ